MTGFSAFEGHRTERVAAVIRSWREPALGSGAAAWAPGEDRYLVRLLRGGMTCRQIAGKLRLFARTSGRRVSDVVARVEWLLGPDALRAGRLEPIELALLSLFGAAVEDAGAAGGFRLRGRPADASMVVRAANAARAVIGQAPIAWPGVADR